MVMVRRFCNPTTNSMYESTTGKRYEEDYECDGEGNRLEVTPPPPKMPTPPPKRVISSCGYEVKPRTNCKWWQSHDWSKWEVYKTGAINGYPEITQKRECSYCGKIKLRQEDSV